MQGKYDKEFAEWHGKQQQFMSASRQELFDQGALAGFNGAMKLGEQCHAELLAIHEIACCGWANVLQHPITPEDTLTVRDVKIMAMELMKARPYEEIAWLRKWHTEIVALSAGWDQDGSTGPREPLSWESVGRAAMDYARAALSAPDQGREGVGSVVGEYAPEEIEHLRECAAKALAILNTARCTTNQAALFDLIVRATGPLTPNV